MNDVIDAYLREQGRPGDMELDAAYQIQIHVIRSMLGILEDSLKAEGVTGETAVRVTRRLVYGSAFPDEGNARLRMREREEAVRALMLAPPDPAVIRDLLDLPPR